MKPRAFPFSPTSATSLAVGDLIPVQGLSGNWACLQVVEVQPRKRKHFIVALLPWRGGSTPGTADVAGLVPLKRALSGIQIFTEGHVQVIGNAEPNDEEQERFYGPGYVGKVTSVWGWKATIWHAQDAADGGVSLTDPN